MRRRARILAAALLSALALAALGASPAGAAFGLNGLGVLFEEGDGSPAVGAGSHPFALTTTLEANTTIHPDFGEVPEDAVRDLLISFPAGMVGNPTAVPQCSSADFAFIVDGGPSCAAASAIGTATVRIGVGLSPPSTVTVAVYNLAPAPGTAAKIGFVPLGVPVTADLGVNPDPPHNVLASLEKVPQPVRFYGSVVTVWGNPASPAHDADRGTCATDPKGSCPVSLPEKPFLTSPRSCTGPLEASFATRSWQDPATWLSYPVQTPYGMSGCANLGFAPGIGAEPTTSAASSASGLAFDLDIDDEGLTSPTGTAGSDIKKAVVTLPQGMTVNPGVAEGLATCSQAQLAKESAFSEAGEGCPQASKVGEVEVETPLLEGKLLKGQIFVAAQKENPFGSLIALYMVIKDPGLGILVKLAGRVEPDPQTGQLITTFGEAGHEIPQFPFSRFRFRFREGARAPLITPPACGTYTTRATFTPWANPTAPYTATASFEITQGPGGGPCPPPGTPPFDPGFQAGSLDNRAGSHATFLMRLTRSDADQDLTRFDATLPPGLVGKLAGISQCPEAAIAQGKAKSGRAEQASPSCPATSQIGRTLAGAGVGSQLTYVPGSLYLAGPFSGAPLSVVAIVPAVAGPFDVGTVVVREALRIDPRTARVSVDGASSDPIPHILAGIPLKVRDIRVYADRPDFTLNPTSCDPFSVDASLWGGGSDLFSKGDDAPRALSSPFQVTDCAALGFKPRLSLRLKGGTKRGGHPALTGTYRPRPGDANLEGLVLRLPRSAFLDQAHIRTICTRVQFAQKACPQGAVYGHATATTPLLEEPLSGPVYLRSSDHNLPDFVADLHGLIDVEAPARIDSVKGGIRATFADLPDAPLTKVVVQMQGAKKGLIVNSTDLCAAPHRANATFSGQNGAQATGKPAMKAAGCKGGRKRERHHKGGGR